MHSNTHCLNQTPGKCNRIQKEMISYCIIFFTWISISMVILKFLESVCHYFWQIRQLILIMCYCTHHLDFLLNSAKFQMHGGGGSSLYHYLYVLLEDWCERSPVMVSFFISELWASMSLGLVLSCHLEKKHMSGFDQRQICSEPQ